MVSRKPDYMSTYAFYQAFNKDGKKVLEESIAHGDWYDSERPAIDDEDFRARLEIIRIKGYYFNQDKSVKSIWENRYDSAGAITESSELDAAGNVTSKTSFEYSTTGEIVAKMTWKEDGTCERESLCD